jgi:hypothetical protein
MAELDKDRAVELLNRILEAESAGVVRYTHYSFLVFGHNRIPIVSWLREQAAESLTHAQHDGEAAALTREAVELRLAGDQGALRLCLDRTVAPRRERATSQQPASPGSKSRAAALQDCRTGPWRTARAGPAPPVSPVLSGRDQASLHLVRSPGTAIGASCTA